MMDGWLNGSFAPASARKLSMPSLGHDDSLLDRLRADQSRRWGRGEHVLVESYLQQHPELASDPEAVLALLYAEALLRLEADDAPTLDDYLSRFPQYAEPLRQRWAVHGLLAARNSERPTTTAEIGPPPGPPSRLLPLPALPGYEVLGELGQGGMGVVFLARQVAFDRLVAVKMMRAHLLAGPIEATRFRTEALALGQLDHPHIVRVHAFGEDHDCPYLVMEYLPGGSLAQLLRQGPLPIRRAVELVRQVALGVQAAHERGILHRDLKPANVLLSAACGLAGQPMEGPAKPQAARQADLVAKVADFGLAKLLDDDSGQTASAVILGTPAYMAPEQAAGKMREVGRAADVWALGAILYECLTGKPPFLGAGKQETLRLVQTARLVPPRRLRPEVPAGLEAVCLKALQKGPRHRYAAVADLAGDLVRWLEGGRPRPRLPSRGEVLLDRLGARPAHVGLVLLALLVSLLVLGMQPAARPYSHAELEQTLARARPTDLMPAAAPRLADWLVGGQMARTSRADDGSFTVLSAGLSLLELARDPMRPRFRLRAQVRHLRSEPIGEVGLFVAHQRLQLPGGAGHQFTQITFNDIIDAGQEYDEQLRDLPEEARKDVGPRPRNGVLIMPNLYAGTGWREGHRLRTAGARTECFAAAGPQGGPWRELTVEVTPDEVRAYWGRDRQPAGRLAVRDVLADMAQALRVAPEAFRARAVRPAFKPRGGLGLLVERGAASFRNVVIEPLDQQ
jgi:serine/threonine protein kinase